MCEIYSAQPDKDKCEIQCAPNLGRIKFILYKLCPVKNLAHSISRLLSNKTLKFMYLPNIIDLQI